jgi:CheY-like chemotaxis protein
MKKDLQILMLEDVPADAELIDSALRRGGFSFQAKRVDTREEFLREIEGRPPDVILSDHGLPSFDGFAALSITREKCPDTPFIFVTGSMGEEVAVDSWRHGATDYVLKTQLSNLAPAVQRALHLSADKRKREQTEKEWHESEERLRLRSAECEQRIQDHLTELHTVYGAMELFASSLSDELRAPLGHFESLVKILQNDAGRHMDEKSRHYLRTICESLCQAGRMISDLLAFSPSSHAGLHYVRVNLVEVIKNILYDLWSELENRQTARCRCELPGDGGTPSLLRHALYNLIADALAGQPAQSEMGRLLAGKTGQTRN